jgi:hypothetical protein
MGFELSIGLNRHHFRCPNCLGIVSVPVAAISKPMMPATWMLKQVATKDLKIESVGNSKASADLVGKEFPLATLQEWANSSPGT